MLLCAWLGGMGTDARPGELGRLLTLEEVGEAFNGGRLRSRCSGLGILRAAQLANHPFRPLVPVNLKDRDAFHITIEEYLMSLASITDEMSRLAVNSVTLGDNELAVRISTFVRDLHAGFQLLNLKNDQLRRKVDGIKYAVKKAEDVVYDLSLRNLIPTAAGAS